MASNAPTATVYAAAAAANLAAVIVRPAQGALLPAHARTPRELAAANSVATASEGIGVLLGPLIGRSGVGMLNASMGMGVAAGGMLTLLLVGRRNLAPGIRLGALVWGAGLALVAVVPWTFVALAVLVLGGAGLALMDTSGRRCSSASRPRRS